MSKMDNLRAMREARYEQDRARAAKGTAAPKSTATAAKPAQAVAKPARAAAKPAEASGAVVVGSEELCGHRNMSGRTCTREKGHAAKSHRYS